MPESTSPDIQHTEMPLAQPASRMEELAVLPVFLKLRGRRVLLAGGSPAAAWKAELLAASGAHVEIVAEEISDEMAALLARGAADGMLSHRARPWSRDDFSDIAIALADMRDDAGAEAFHRAARAANVPVNIIDNPQYCDFQFGTIVNRSPVVIGVSTDGAAPILGQTIRRKIETLLPPSLAEAGMLARDFRARLREIVPDAFKRRAFWEAFAERIFRLDRVSEKALLDLAHAARSSPGKAGFVSIVGAGPGDADLLTIGAVRALQAADVVMYDDLSSPSILELARREAERVYVGKRGGRKSCSQAEINKMMVNLAASGKRVARLKGGDPMVFGRAGEEIGDLVAAEIPFEVVPGVTAASAAAASIGVSLTHRDHAQSVRFVTGHAKSGKVPENLHWQGLAAGDATLVFYMASRTGHEVSENLMKHGMNPGTPVVIVANASRPNERVWKGTLATLTHGIGEISRGDPIVICIGTVFSLYSPERTIPFGLPAAKEISAG